MADLDSSSEWGMESGTTAELLAERWGEVARVMMRRNPALFRLMVAAAEATTSTEITST
jgi:hypothetical protein